MKITEVEITLIKPKEGLVGFASLVLADCLYVSSIGIYTRPNGGYRLTYPTKVNGSKNINIFHPINKILADQIHQAVIDKFEKVMNSNDRYNCTNPFTT